MQQVKGSGIAIAAVLVTVACIQPLAGELPYALVAAIKKKKRKPRGEGSSWEENG